MYSRTFLVLFLGLLSAGWYLSRFPSYIHPDENFQGPEVIAGKIFDFRYHETWEFTTANPVRSVFPLWIVYGLPLILRLYSWALTGKEVFTPEEVFYTLRIIMFLLSFVLENWAIHELVASPDLRQQAFLLVASSYVTWTYQMHTFSNSVETLIVLWSIVTIQRILDNKHRTNFVSSAILGVLVTLGVFNRITFPAFLLVPGSFLLSHCYRRPLSLVAIVGTTALTTLLAVFVDTCFYKGLRVAMSTRALLREPLLTPLNSLLYNTSTANLSLHGLHPFYRHVLPNLPLLLGPALFLWKPNRNSSLRCLSALSGVVILSLIPHQEPRFLLPVIPLYLSSVQLPQSKRLCYLFLAAWVIFNCSLGVFMGVYHQGGVIPAQIAIGEGKFYGMTEVLWWRTYSPPVWLLGRENVTSTDLMGISFDELYEVLDSKVSDGRSSIGLIAPFSSTELDQWQVMGGDGDFLFRPVWKYRKHLNLDDLDIGDEGALGTLKRVIGRRGLVLYHVMRLRNGTLGRDSILRKRPAHVTEDDVEKVWQKWARIIHHKAYLRTGKGPHAGDAPPWTLVSESILETKTSQAGQSSTAKPRARDPKNVVEQGIITAMRQTQVWESIHPNKTAQETRFPWDVRDEL